MQIAIIGAGISGLTVAHTLREQHDVLLIEANPYIGGHTNTIDVEAGGARYSVDTGFIVFNYRTYPNFTRLLDELGVESQPTSMTFSVRCERTGLEYRGGDLNGLFAQRANLVRGRFYRLLAEMLRFNRRAVQLIDELDETVTVGEFFQRERFSREFLEQYFLPMGSAVWSCPHDTFEQFPLLFILQFYRNHGMLSVTDRVPWRVIRGGSQQYVRAILRRLDGRFISNCPVEQVERGPDSVTIQTRLWRRRFDHVVFACHSDQALRILGAQATAEERELLGAFPYGENVALLHTDTTVLPVSRRAWASWNYFVPGRATEKATVTYDMNILQGLRAREEFLVTLNGEDRVHPDKILRRIVYHHPIFTTNRSTAQQRHQEVINRHRTSFCGAYWGNGFHEDGVSSALQVCAALGKTPCTVASIKAGFDTGGSRPSITDFTTPFA